MQKARARIEQARNSFIHLKRQKIFASWCLCKNSQKKQFHFLLKGYTLKLGIRQDTWQFNEWKLEQSNPPCKRWTIYLKVRCKISLEQIRIKRKELTLLKNLKFLKKIVSLWHMTSDLPWTKKVFSKKIFCH